MRIWIATFFLPISLTGCGGERSNASPADETANFVQQADAVNTIEDSAEDKWAEAEADFDNRVMAFRAAREADGEMADQRKYMPQWREFDHGETWIGDCGDLGYFGLSDADLQNELNRIAYAHENLSTKFIQYGVPEEVWRPVMGTIRKLAVKDMVNGSNDLKEWANSYSHHVDTSSGSREIDENVDPLYAKAVEEVNKNWKNPEVIIHPEPDGCGAGEDIITISTSPKGGSIFLISGFKRYLCEGRGIDPFNTQDCQGWEQYADGSVNDVVGDYFYIASWPNGEIIQGSISFDDDRYENSVTLTPKGMIRRRAD